MELVKLYTDKSVAVKEQVLSHAVSSDETETFVSNLFNGTFHEVDFMIKSTVKVCLRNSTISNYYASTKAMIACLVLFVN